MKKKLIVIGAVIASILAILIVLPFAFEGKIEKLIKQEANKTMKAKLEFSNLNLSFIRNFPKATIGLHNLAIIGVNEFSNDTLMAADELRISVDLMSIFSSKGYSISQILLDKANIQLKVLKDGKVNWDIMLPTPPDQTEAEAPSSFKMILDKIEATDSKFSYVDKQGNMSFTIKDLGAVCSGNMNADVTTLKVNAAAAEMNFVMDKIPYLHKIKVDVDGEIEADLKNSKYTFHQNLCHLNAIEGVVEGWFAMPEEGYDMDIKLTTPQLSFKQVLSIVPGMFTKEFDNIKTDGKVSLDAWAKGHYADNILPAFNLALKVNDAMFKYPDLPKSVDGIQMDMKVSNPGGDADLTVVDLKQLQFKIGGNPFSMMALVKTPVSNADFLMQANGKIDLAMIKEIYPLEKGTELNGKLTSNLSVKGTMNQIDKEQYEQINAAGTLSISDMIYKSKGYPDANISNMGMNFTPRFVELSNMKLKFGKTDLSGNGRLENFIGYALKGKTLKGSLNISSNKIDVSELMGTTSSSTTTDTSKMKAFEIPKNIDFVMQANVKMITYEKMIFENATGKLIVRDGKLDFNGLKMNAFGGIIETNGYYSTALDPQKPDINFGLNISNASYSQTFKQLDFIKKMMPIFENTIGDYSVNFKMNGKLDENLSPDLKSLLAQGLLQSKNVSVKDVKAFDALALAMKDDKFKTVSMKDLKLPFEVKDGKVTTKPFDIKLGDAMINLSGVTTLDQAIMYDGKVTLPEGYTSKLGANISNVNFKIGGTFTKPAVSLDMKSLAKSVAKQAATQGIQKALGVKNDAEMQAKMAAIRKDAQDKANALIEQADVQAQKLVAEAKNPIAKFAAQKAAEQLKKEAQKKAQSLIDDADKKAQELNQ
ncbi:MAG: AsmA-like C-terminal region-containing protein [Bacteroidales bacterium]|nr:AsmA-like C-terminal region-containing protein [Bacteroidales bacterium]